MFMKILNKINKLLLVFFLMQNYFTIDRSFAEEIYEPDKCLRSIGEKIFSINKDIFDNIYCPRIEGEKRQLIERMKYIRKKLKEKKSLNNMDFCKKMWMQKIYKSMRKSNIDNKFSNYKKYIYSFFNTPYENAFKTTDAEKYIISSSALEVSLTDFGMKTKEIYSKQDYSSCNHIIFPIILMRDYNVALVKKEKISNLFKKGKITPNIYIPLWFIVQHADYYPNFQKKWLRIFKKYGKDINFPQGRIESLEKRISFNEENN
ncbi:hypothetical protein [Yunchengibacter salinarum]|uniref:hypothetical protein n=1 Tax=Yunchengibacter salinarum TaxID=3133399 RepID=UPI0035B59474